MKKINICFFMSVLLACLLNIGCNLITADQSKKIGLTAAEHGTAEIHATKSEKKFILSVKPDTGYFFMDKNVYCFDGEDSWNRYERLLPLTKIEENKYSFELDETELAKKILMISVLFEKQSEKEYSNHIVHFDLWNGYVSSEKRVYSKGEKVEFLTVPDSSNYKMSDEYPQVISASRLEIPVTQDSKWPNKYSFIMPDEDVTVKITYKYDYSSGSDTTLYTVTVDPSPNGQVRVKDKSQYKSDTWVCLEIIPDSGYKVGFIYAIFNGFYLRDVSLKSSVTNEYEFYMPESDVRVYVEFKPE